MTGMYEQTKQDSFEKRTCIEMDRNHHDANPDERSPAQKVVQRNERKSDLEWTRDSNEGVRAEVL